MSGKNKRSPAFAWIKLLLILAVLPLLATTLVGCDRGASVQIETARKFADAVTRNDTTRRDSMIATAKFKEYFANEYVASDMMAWFRSFYDYHKQEFTAPAVADVDQNLTKDLGGALLDTNEIEETGMVKVKTQGIDGPYFWMVKQHNQNWKVAIVTKGEMQVNFH